MGSQLTPCPDLTYQGDNFRQDRRLLEGFTYLVQQDQDIMNETESMFLTHHAGLSKHDQILARRAPGSRHLYALHSTQALESFSRTAMLDSEAAKLKL